jgi:hypothetical protein
MIVMERNAEVTPNELNDALARPQPVGPAVNLRPLQKKGFQATMLFGGQAWRWTRVGFSGQAVRLSSPLKPAVDRTTVDAKNARHRLRTFSVMDSCYCLTSPPFQLRGGSKWSTHKELEGRNTKTILWQRSWQ